MKSRAKEPKLVSLKEAVILLNDAYGNDKEKSGRDVVSIKTMYNKINLGQIVRYGPKHFCMVDVNEILSLFGPKKSA